MRSSLTATYASHSIRQPCAFLAADYVCLSRLALYLGQDVTKNCLVFPVTALVKFFVIMDVTTFLIQAAGGGITASTQNNPSLGSSGQIVSTIGLSLQLASFLAYTIVLILFGIKVWVSDSTDRYSFWRQC